MKTKRVTQSFTCTLTHSGSLPRPLSVGQCAGLVVVHKEKAALKTALCKRTNKKSNKKMRKIQFESIMKERVIAVG